MLNPAHMACRSIAVNGWICSHHCSNACTRTTQCPASFGQLLPWGEFAQPKIHNLSVVCSERKKHIDMNFHGSLRFCLDGDINMPTPPDKTNIAQGCHQQNSKGMQINLANATWCTDFFPQPWLPMAGNHWEINRRWYDYQCRLPVDWMPGRRRSIGYSVTAARCCCRIAKYIVKVIRLNTNVQPLGKVARMRSRRGRAWKLPLSHVKQALI